MSELKLGKKAPKKDPRNLKALSLFKRRELPYFPPYWFVDTPLYSQGFNIPVPMFKNDEYGCCVISGRAHQSLRFETDEQKKLFEIDDHAVVNQYLKESDGEDNGLYTLDSLKTWRRDGWEIRGINYKIHAFAEIDPKSPEEVKASIYTFQGIGAGFQLPILADEQFKRGQLWDTGSITNLSLLKIFPGSWGGHYVYICGYTELGPVCITWGKKHQMTWKFFKCYCDEAYAIIDARDLHCSSSLDVETLEARLAEITA